jgi:hypothetical protein
MTGDVSRGTNVKAKFGASDDLQIYHDGSNSNINDTGTGNLNIRGDSQIWFQSGDGSYTYAIFNDNGESALYYDNAKKLATTSTGIDVTGVAKASTLSLSGTTAFSAGTISQDANWGMYFKAATAGAQAEFSWVNSTGSERMRIDSAGRVGIGTASPGTNTKLTIATTTSLIWPLKLAGKNYGGVITLSDTSGYALYFTAANVYAGAVTLSGGTTTYATGSDYRLKENVVPMTGSIDRLKALKPSKFNFIADPLNTVDGFLAHEAQSVVPECVTGTKDAMKDEEYEVTPAVMDGETVVTEAVMGTRSVPDYQGIDQSKLVPLLVASLQEAVAKIEALEARVTALEV